MSDTIIFDIETGPLPEEIILPGMPSFEPPANIKDPAKIAEREKAYKAQYIQEAALSPLTGKVIAIGYKYVGQAAVNIICQEEWTMLTNFWDLTVNPMKTLVGFNSNGFDLPYLMRRSWALGVRIPGHYRNRGKFWSELSIDLRDTWQLGDRNAKGSLDSICRCFGLGQKNGSGEDFAKLWESDRAKAIQYLENDVLLTEKLYFRMIGGEY